MHSPRKIDILGVKFDYVTFEEAQNRLLEFLEGNVPRAVFTPNPEFVMLARKDAEFKHILNGADMCLPDGIGIVLASRLGKHKLRERVTGYDTILSLLEKLAGSGKEVYFYGGAPGVAEEAKRRLVTTYPGLKITGCRDGFLDEKAHANMLWEIKMLKPDMLIVGTGSPRQEKWIAKHKDELPCKLIIGAGGSFDGFSGRVPRAPAVFVKLNIEWLYRLVRQPKRIKRQIKLPLFMLAVLFEKIKERLV